MRHCICVLLGVVALVAATVSTRALSGSEDAVKLAFLELHAAVQQRFLDTSRGFGFARMARVPNPRMTRGRLYMTFEPENDQERSALARLEALSIDTAMYLGGRQLLVSDQSEPAPVPSGMAHRDLIWGSTGSLQGPLALVSQEAVQPPPSGALLADARRAFTEIEMVGSAEFSVDGWRFVAGALRAVDESCVVCHTTRDRQVGSYVINDVLGIVLYASHAR